MPQDLFSDPGPDGEEPGSFPLPPPAEETGPEDGWDGHAEQGLYICLPAGEITLEGFAQNGRADTMAPGPLLATIVDAVTGDDAKGLAGCSDDQLMGIISAARRMEARASWTLTAAIAEYAARHSGGQPLDAFAADELAFALHLTSLSASEQMQYSTSVATRLPQTFAALHAGRIHPVHLQIIEDETSILSDQDAAKADKLLAGAAPGMTFGEVRSAAHRLVLKLDPEAVRKRKEAAKSQTHVRPFRERSGNAGLIGRELPSDEVLASWQNVEQRARDLRAAGMPGSLRELRVRAYLDLLQERDSRVLLADGGRPAEPAAPDQPPADGEPSAPDQAPPDSPPPDPGSVSGRGPSLAALVTLTIPWSTYQGWSETPGQADGFGILDGDDARDLAAAAARHPRTRWCVTALDPDGTAAAHACLPGRHPPYPRPGPGAACGPAPPPGTGPPGHPSR